jgi:hypothetical protein
MQWSAGGEWKRGHKGLPETAFWSVLRGGQKTFPDFVLSDTRCSAIFEEGSHLAEDDGFRSGERHATPKRGLSAMLAPELGSTFRHTPRCGSPQTSAFEARGPYPMVTFLPVNQS